MRLILCEQSFRSLGFATFILILSGSGLYFSGEGVNNVLVKSGIVFILVVISVVLNLIILPKMIKRSLLFMGGGEVSISPMVSKTSLILNSLMVLAWVGVLVFSVKM